MASGLTSIIRILMLAIWAAGALYALLGAISLSELGTAMPQAGGFYIYARRAFGPAAGFATGWADWLNNCAVVGSFSSNGRVCELPPL